MAAGLLLTPGRAKSQQTAVADTLPTITIEKAIKRAKAEYLFTRAEVEGLKAKLRMLNLNVKSILEGEIYRSIPVKVPITGYIKMVNVSIGEYVSPGDVLFEIVNNSNIHADLKVFEKEIFKVEEGQKVYFTIYNSPGRQYTATIYSVGQAFEKNPKTVRVHAKIKGRTEKLIPGMYIKGQIAVNNTLTTALPQTAIFGAGNESYIFIKRGETNLRDEEGQEVPENSWTFKRIPITTGVEQNDWIAVNFFEPLPDSAKIVYRGTYKLISEMGKLERSHGH